MTASIAANTVGIPEDKTRILVVEGPEDKTFFEALATHLGIHEDLFVVVCGGKNSLAATLANILADGNFHNIDHIGIICDNDYPDNRDGKGALEVVCEEIDRANDEVSVLLRSSRQLPMPSRPREAAGAKPKVSLLLLPDDDEDGMLESLVLEAIGEDEITKCVDEFYACLGDKAQLNLRQARMPRSRLSVYISGKILDEKYATNDDSRRWFLTQAVDMKWWNDERMWERSAFTPAKTFLTQLLAH